MNRDCTSSRACSPFRRSILTRVAAIALLIAGCAPLPDKPAEDDRKTLIFPPPPNEARFVYERTIYSSADIVADNRESQLRQMLTGEARKGTPLVKPYAVAVHKGRVFLSDSVERFVKAFDIPTGRYFSVGETGEGLLKKPLGLDVDRDGNLYVADITERAIQVFDRDGKHLRRLGGEQWFDRVASVTVEPSGERIYAVDIGGVSSENHRVRVFDAKTGAHLHDIGTRGTGPGQFNLPRDVAIARNGRLYVVDGGNFRVQVFEHDGRYLQSFGAVGRQLGNFARPKEIASDRDGNIYVVDAAFGNFQIFNADGELLLFIGERSERDGPARYMLPSGIYVDEDGRVYMVDQWFRKVDVFRPAGLKAGEGHAVLRPVAPRAGK